MRKRELNLSYKIIIIIIISSLLIFALPSCVPKGRESIQEVEEDVIALVDGEKIYKEEFDELYEAIGATGIYKDLNECKVNALKNLIETKVEEQKIIELGITASDEEAREIYEESFKNYNSNLEEFLEESTVLEEQEYLDIVKEGIKLDRLYQMDGLLKAQYLIPEERIKARSEYLDTLIKESKIGVREEYFDLISEVFVVEKLNVKK